MLADAEDEGVVDDQAGALGLCDVQVVALGVRRWVAGYESVRWVLSGVGDGQCQSKRMWVVLVRMLFTVSASVSAEGILGRDNINIPSDRACRRRSLAQLDLHRRAEGL